ncbi:MAG: VOC family protein [Chloroflexi bacterium]|nr:VOC family protein [Chloroflexota bacterium]
MFKRIDHVEIVPTDFDRSVSFYTTVLGFNIKQRMKRDKPPMREIAFLQLGDTLIELLSYVTPPVPFPREQMHVGYRMMAIEVEDMDKAVDYLRGKGVQITREPIALGGKAKRAEIADPDGTPIELRQR